jgi:hypothetical protein
MPDTPEWQDPLPHDPGEPERPGDPHPNGTPMFSFGTRFTSFVAVFARSGTWAVD